MKKYIEEIEKIELKINNNNNKVKLKEIIEIEKEIRERQDLTEEELLISNKLTNLKQLVKDKNNSIVTKWDIFVLEMENFRDIKEIKPLYELIDYINEKKNDTITKTELEEMEGLYSRVIPLIHDNLTYSYRDRTITEINKKLKLFHKRLDRVVEDDFGSWLKALRKSKGYSLKQLELQSGVTASYIHRLERGERKTPSVPVAESLAKGLGISSEEILLKLKLITPNKSKQNLSLFNLVNINDFTIKEELVTKEQKENILKLITFITNAKWSNETKINETLRIVEIIDKLKTIS